MIKSLKVILSILVVNATTTLLFGQTNEESLRISELYELLPVKNNLYGTEVFIYDFKVKGKKILDDSSLVARITILQPEMNQNTFEYDTTGLEILKYEVDQKNRIPVKKLLLDNDKRVIEASTVNEDLEVLSKTFYRYENNKLLSEESFTGYAYLDQPRRLSLITYQYEGNKLTQKSKKYSLNGTNWIQTWTSRYDKLGNEIWMEEIDEDNTITYNNEFEKGKIIKSQITQTNEKTIIKEITYNKQGYPASILLYYSKTKKNIRLTKYFYR